MIPTSLSYHLISNTQWQSFILSANWHIFWITYSRKQWKMNQNMCSDALITNHHIDYESVYWINFRFFTKTSSFFLRRTLFNMVGHPYILNFIDSLFRCCSLDLILCKMRLLYFILWYLFSSCEKCCSTRARSNVCDRGKRVCKHLHSVPPPSLISDHLIINACRGVAMGLIGGAFHSNICELQKIELRIEKF